MKISTETLSRIARYSLVTMIGSCGTSFYLAYPTEADKQMAEIQENKDSINERVLSCLPREKNTYLSDQCLDLVKRYDSAARGALAFENSHEYITSQQRKKYSIYLANLSAFCLGIGFLSSSVLRKRREEEQQNQPPGGS